MGKLKLIEIEEEKFVKNKMKHLELSGQMHETLSIKMKTLHLDILDWGLSNKCIPTLDSYIDNLQIEGKERVVLIEEELEKCKNK